MVIFIVTCIKQKFVIAHHQPTKIASHKLSILMIKKM